jgi:hypothetical protein
VVPGYFQPKVYRPEQIVEGKDVDLERLRIPKEAGFNLPYPKLQKMTWGLRKGEILTLTAGSGIGKSNIVVETGVGIIPIIHLKRVQGKKFNKGDEVELTDLRGCVDRDTEFLTPTGWKKISEWDANQDMVMVVDDKMVGKYEWADYLAVPCREGFVHFETNRMDMMLSDEHRIVYHTEKDKQSLREIAVEEALGIHAVQSTGFRGLIPCILNGVTHSSPFLSEIEVRVHVMVSSDGWTRNHETGRCSVRVKKERKKERARDLLDLYTKDWFEFDVKGGYTEFTFTAPLREKGYRLFFNQGSDVMRWVVDEIKFWDGELSTGKVTSVNKLDADFLQLAYTVCGQRTPLSVRERGKCFDGRYDAQTQYIVNPTKETHTSFRKAPNSKCEITRVPSVDGMKYCFETSTGAWLARRNGKIFVTGNSAGAEQMSWNVWALERNQQAEDGNKDLVRIRVLKNRTMGFTGLADTLRYDHQTGRLLLHTTTDFDQQE